MNKEKAKDIIQYLCDNATCEAKKYGIDINFADGLILSYHSDPYDKFRIGINAKLSNGENKFYTLNTVFNTNGLNFWNKFDGNFYFFNQDEFVHRVNDTNWCIILNKLIEHSGAYFEFPSPDVNAWQSKLTVLQNEIKQKYLEINAKCQINGENPFYTAEYKALINMYRPLMSSLNNNIRQHGFIKIPLVPTGISSLEQLMIWMDLKIK